jgi:hypothetical protein
MDIHFSNVALGWTVSTATFVGWTVIIAMLLWLDIHHNKCYVLHNLYNNFYGKDSLHSEVALGRTVSSAKFVG